MSGAPVERGGDKNGVVYAEYQKRVDAGQLHYDPVQDIAVQALQRVYNDVERCTVKGAGFFGLFKAKQTPPRGLYMHGGVGRGKSMVMDLFFGLLPENIKARRVHFHEFMIEVHDYIAQRSGHGYDRALPDFAADIASECRVLCFDEFHVTDIADAMILGRLFTALFDRGVVVVATSNWAPDDLYKNGLQRELFLPFIDLLKTRVQVLHLDSDNDYRMKVLAEEGHYITPLGEQTSQKMRRIFRRLSDGVPPEAQVIKVKGRKIKIDQAASGVALVSFQMLCERPHGAEDFLALAQRFHTVLIENIPKMNYDRRNEAKRFILLIDALYEAGTNVVFSAETGADNIYQGEDHAYEFQRTISRINEMQSLQWLERK